MNEKSFDNVFMYNQELIKRTQLLTEMIGKLAVIQDKQVSNLQSLRLMLTRIAESQDDFEARIKCIETVLEAKE